MSRRAVGGGRDGPSAGKRYAGTEQRGESAWKREWSSFISGIEMKQVRDGTRAIALKSSKDLEQEVERRQQQQEQSSSEGLAGEADGAPMSYSYLFATPAQKRAEREAKMRKQKEEERQRRIAKERERKQRLREKRLRNGENVSEEDSDDEASKHQKALKDAIKRGLQLEGMTRKEKRKFLQLTVTEEQQKAAEHAKEFKLHELMDERLAWYQQGPHPIDLISEKLVKKKADKKGKQLGLKYNYLVPHASWLAKRMQRRREAVKVALGRVFVFDDDGNAFDALHHSPVDMTKVNSLLTQPLFRSGEEAATDANTKSGHEGKEFLTIEDPRNIQTSFVRKVLHSKDSGEELKRANLRTNFLSSDIVRKPTIGLDD